ncbi:MAG: LacI family DNA-binding transcriptional regulator [Verrucomicrobia bacterium]|nr:LacI family DNA-binding transcriptional regulator [Verrucomicrobiota bacterium]
MVTQRDIAQAAGLSQATVSLALRRHPGLPATTIDRVHAAAASLGYRPDPLISALMSQRQARKPGGTLRAKIAFLTAFPSHRLPRPAPPPGAPGDHH